MEVYHDPYYFFSKFNVALMLPFCMNCLNVLDISAIADGFWTLVKSFWMVSPSKSSSSNSRFFHKSRCCSKDSWCSFYLEVSEGRWSNKFDIIMMAWNNTSFNGEALTHSFKSHYFFNISFAARSWWQKEKIFTPKNDLIIYGIYSARANTFTILWPGILSWHIHRSFSVWG